MFLNLSWRAWQTKTTILAGIFLIIKNLNTLIPRRTKRKTAQGGG
jgi:hypothetical protein